MSVDERLGLFDELVPSLRYHHMTLDFLACRVFQYNLMEKSKHRKSVLQSALIQRQVPPDLVAQAGVSAGSCNRGIPPSDACWELKASFSLEEVAAVEMDGGLEKWCGPVAGSVAGLEVQRWSGDGMDWLCW